MIRMIRTVNLRALQEGAELAADLEADLEIAEAAVEAHKKDAAADAGLRQQLVTDLGEVRTELVAAESRESDLLRLLNLLLAATKYAFDAADAPLHLVLHEGRVHSTHRDRKAAEAVTPYADCEWVPMSKPNPNPFGWKIHRAAPPALPSPEGAGEIEALMERLERPALEQLGEANRLQALTGELETVRAQRDTAIEDTGTAAAALTAESLAYAFYRAAVTEAVTEIAMALSTKNPRASLREVSGLLIRHAELFGIDSHGPQTGADTEKKGAAL
ncbi:hypothetical protein [Streptomyces sp. NPDC001930]|uniref:hypothetical protein n=1 Tax=Streptomyces sp. NPDC001930 TaxID=3364625 RepID=UPI0036A14E93